MGNPSMAKLERSLEFSHLTQNRFNSALQGLPNFFLGTPNYNLSISNKARPLAAGPIRNAGIMEDLLVMAQNSLVVPTMDAQTGGLYK